MTALARNTDPETSHDAARGVKISVLENIVLASLKILGPQTAEEIASSSEIDLQSITPRMRPLANKNYVRDSGQRRPGKSGTKRIVWERIG